MRTRILVSSLALAASLPAFAGFPPAPLTDWGEATHFGDGHARAFVTSTPSGKPIFFGVQFDASWDSLPAHAGHHGPTHEYNLPMPASAAALLPFDHVTLDWNPHGHEPPGIYDIPHIDVHVYLISMAERMEIAFGDCAGAPLTCEALERALAPLPPEAQPPFHFDLGAVAPFMGNHLIDLRSDEFTPLGFSNTFMFGKWDGGIAFLEPMITRAHFESLEEADCRVIDNPDRFTTAGWYPTSYCVRSSGGVQTVTLEGFQRYDAVE